jgi:hypothetical protein
MCKEFLDHTHMTILCCQRQCRGSILVVGTGSRVQEWTQTTNEEKERERVRKRERVCVRECMRGRKCEDEEYTPQSEYDDECV